MKVIDLLNKIANGEEVPKKIKWGCHNLEWFVYEYYKATDEVGKPSLNEIMVLFTEPLLNDEIEIIEEDKPIEKIEFMGGYDIPRSNGDRILELQEKINEIIDKLNKESKDE